MDWIDRAPGIRPRATFGRRLDILARASFPAVSTILVMLLAAAPLGLPMQAALLPACALGCVWFWSLFRPASLPPPLVFLIGLLFELLGYMPLGAGVLTLLSVHAIAVRVRAALVPLGFVAIWLAYAAVAALASLLGWGLGSLLPFRLLPLPPAGFEAALAVALYPALAVPFRAANRTIADPGRA